MAFSLGQSFFKDLLEYSDKHAKDDKELKTTYAHKHVQRFFK